MDSIKMRDLNLKQLRNIYGLKQSEVAGYLGLTKQGYNYKESGERTFKVHELTTLSKLFGIDIDTLVVIINNKQDNIFKANID